MIATTSVLIRERLGEPCRMINEGVYTKANFYFLDSDRTILEANYSNNPKGFANREQTNLENGKRVSFEDETITTKKHVS